jgi:hypothetical protein
METAQRNTGLGSLHIQQTLPTVGRVMPWDALLQLRAQLAQLASAGSLA